MKDSKLLNYSNLLEVLSTETHSVIGKNISTVNLCLVSAGVPEAPEMPTVREVYATNALVLWNRPRDGGKPITNYILEKKEPTAKRWSRATREPLYPATQYRVQDLVEGCEYEFRVMAENELGTGDPSPPSKPILAKDPIGQ